MDASPKVPLALEVEPGAALPIPLEAHDPVPAGVASERMIQAAFSVSTYVGAMIPRINKRNAAEDRMTHMCRE